MISEVEARLSVVGFETTYKISTEAEHAKVSESGVARDLYAKFPKMDF